MARKRMAVKVGDTDASPVTSRERDQGGGDRADRMRRNFPEVHGKRVGWIDHGVDNGWLYVAIQFVDGAELLLQFHLQVETASVELWDRSPGKDAILKTYHQKRTRSAQSHFNHISRE